MCLPARCPTCGERRDTSPGRPAAIRRIPVSTGLKRPLLHTSPPVSSASIPRAGPLAEPAAKEQFERFVSGLRKTGVEIVTRRDDPAIEAYETAHTRTPTLWANLYRYEMHWPMLQYRERFADKMPPRLLKGIEDGAHMTLETYRTALTRARKLPRHA